MNATTQTDVGGKIKFVVKKRVSKQLFKLEFETEYFLRFESTIELAKDNAEMPTKRVRKVKAPAEGEASTRVMDLPLLADVVMLDTGEYGQIIVPAVLESELLTHYENESYVGKSFRIVKMQPEKGKRYSPFDIAEIEIDNTPDPVEAIGLEATETPKVKGKK